MEYCDLRLDDGDSTPVVASAYPMLAEWTWRRDPSGEIVRICDGRSLFAEQIRWCAKRRRRIWPFKDHTLIRRTYGGHPDFVELLSVATRQRESLAWHEEVETPPALEVFSLALTQCLLAVHRLPQFTFAPDPEHLSPGT